MDNDDLCLVAKSIAKHHYFLQLSLTPDRVAHYVRTRHEYGLKLDPDSEKTDQGQMARLRSEYFWRAWVNSFADSHREHLAMQGRELGDPNIGLAPYCSDATYKMFETRLEAIAYKLSEQPVSSSLGLVKTQLYRDSQRGKFNRLYLSGKGMVALAQQRHYACGLITLTCPARYHPSSSLYDGSSFKDGHEHLKGIYRKLFRHLGKTFTANDNYFGMRVVEAHLDGCPHWHIVLFSTDEFFTNLTQKLKSIYLTSDRPSGYFEKNQKDIIKLSSAGELNSTPLSYVYKHLAFGFQRMQNEEGNLASKRNLYAIRSAGVRQIQLIGTNGLASKLQALRKVSRSLRDPGHLKAMASGLVQPPTRTGRQIQLSSVVKLLDNGLNQLELIRTPTLNRYGEQSSRLVAIRHKLDLVAHSLASSLALTFQGGALTVNDLNIENNGARDVSPLPPRHLENFDWKLMNGVNDRHWGVKYHIRIELPPSWQLIVTPTRLRWRPPWIYTHVRTNLTFRQPGN